MIARQQGLAAVTAILIVAVAASAAAFTLAQQSAMLDQTAMVVGRAQADAYAQAGLDWARGVLAEDAKRAPAVDSLDEPWAQPIAALPVERAVVGGVITDEQGRFNLNAFAGTAVEDASRSFRALLGGLDLPPDLADAVRDWIDADGDLTSTSGAEDPYYLSLPRPYRAANAPMVQVEELYRVRGFDAAAVARLKPFVTALPDASAKINVNTASAEVLGAVLGLPRDKAAALVAERRAKPFPTAQAFNDHVRKPPYGVTNVPGTLDVKSGFFGVRIHVAQDEVQLATDALVRRGDNGAVAIIWRRPRY